MKSTATETSPIGIFDSGIGGLTVAKAIMKELPHENIIYFGDTARVPYGIKSQENVRNYSGQISRFLISKGVKMIVIACNTASAAAYDSIRKNSDGISVLNVIDAGTSVAVQTGKKAIGVIGTLGTINSGAYEKALKKCDQSLFVTSLACPLLVPLAEEGWLDNEVAQQTLRYYLKPFKSNGVEALILGCTHYPLFKLPIKNYFKGKDIEIIDSAESVAKTARKELFDTGLLNKEKELGSLLCYVSDRPQRFCELAGRFLGREPEHVLVERLQD